MKCNSVTVVRLHRPYKLSYMCIILTRPKFVSHAWFFRFRRGCTPTCIMCAHCTTISVHAVWSGNELVLMLFAILQVRCDARVLKQWYGCVVPSGSSVADVYADSSSRTLNHGKPAADEYNHSSLFVTQIGTRHVHLTQVSSRYYIKANL